jgi:hypothetical protein
MEEVKNPIQHFIDHGIDLIPTLPSGATMGSWKDMQNYTRDYAKLVGYRTNNGVRKFQLYPRVNGLLCLDIDRKNGKDGLKELYRIFSQAGRAMPSYLLDIGTFPAYTATPSNGLHLYFRYQGMKLYRSREIAPGLEAVHHNHLLTAPGSEKDDKPYIFYGDLANAPTAPTTLIAFLTEVTEETEAPIVWEYKQAQHGELSLQAIEQIIGGQGEYSALASRNRFTYEVAKFARKKGYSPIEVEEYIAQRYQAETFTAYEIRVAINSAYKGTHEY